MSVIRTDRWLLESYDSPTQLCKKLTSYFNEGTDLEIHQHLTSHGMYRRPFQNGEKAVNDLKGSWDIVRKEEKLLKKEWDGPNIPIFIFPADNSNQKLKRDFNGKSGLAFKDKLFLFISESNAEKEIKALFTHEYNHVCRLSKFDKNEEDYVLLDTIILEGLAENAVREFVGEDFLANWTTYYSVKELNKLWNNLVLPNKETLNFERAHQDILYGLRFAPKMAGYCAGYYIVKKYMEANDLTSKDLLNKDSRIIAQIKKFN
ncbi:DUF2268 domain-containing protein [Virgibacillus sp. C22-A2]|uniref:DUF2268 domain-containing protein n=1 Tax=Virgibacillus tibetensis TaxID=3042313 RepID=A0ABU6KHD5_9BACI|nr:DUF2268 domain-containing protein [Virgibacillus sp. C22-A2]